MICAECDTDNRPGRKYCARCGARLAVACPECGASNLPDESFCGECGAALPAAAEPAGPAAAGPPPTERRFVSVLFADLVGFTSLSEERDPEEVRSFLMSYFAAARETIERFGGTVDKFIGDAVMAVWGAVAASEDDAERAVRAGLELAGSIPQLGSGPALPSLSVRVGILTGEAAVGPGGNERGLVVGDLVNTASRLQSIAPPGAVLVGESTYRATRSSITYEPLGEQALKGKQLPVPAWRAVGVAGLRGGWHRRDVLEPPFLDREEELRLLKDALHATGRERRARLVAIVGIAGIGKTRLAWEFEKYVDGITEPIYWHEGYSPAYGEGIALWALGEMVRRRAGLAGGEDPVEARERLQAMLDQYVPDARERRWMEPRLAGLLGLVDLPPGERGELFSAFRTLFERVSRLGTTVLLFEDLHLADDGLLDFIEGIPEWSRDHPILVVALARPEILDRRPGWGTGRHSFLYSHLGPLPDEEMRRLVGEISPGAPARVTERVLEAAAGVPLYAVELVRMLIDDGRLVEEDGRFHLAGDLEGLAVPESLHAVIGARLDRLDPPTRALIGEAAVLGQTFTTEALAAVHGGDRAALSGRLAELTRRELLEVSRDPDSPERGRYRFVQSLIREVTYSRLTRRERRERHLQAARYFESLGDDEAAGLIAGHYLSAGAAAEGPEARQLSRRAAAALRAAAERAAALHSHEQALSYCRKALESSPGEEDVPALLELAAESAAALARPDEAEGFAQRLVAWHVERKERGDELRAVQLVGRILVERHEAGRAIQLLEETLLFAEEGRHPQRVAELRAILARAHMLAGDLTKAVEVANASLVAAERHDLTLVIAQNLITKGTALGDLGRLREGVALLQGALELAIEHELPTTELRARTNLSHLTWDDDPVAQLANLRAAFEKARRLGNRGWAVMLIGNLFDVLRATGDFDGALAVLDGLDLEGLPPQQQLSLEMVRLTVLRYRLEPAEARREVERLAALTQDSTDLQSRYYTLVFRSEVAGLDGDHETAYTLSRQAQAVNPLAGGEWLFPAGEAAIWLRDRERVADVLADLAERLPLGRMNTAWNIELEAALSALDDDPEAALAGFEEARRRWEELSLKLHLARNRLHVAWLCAGRPEAAAAAEEGRRLLDQMEAPALAALLETAARPAVPR